MEYDHLRHAGLSVSPPPSPAAGRALAPEVTPGGRPLWHVLASGAVAALLWVAVVYALGRGLSVHELAGGGAAVFLMLPAIMCAVDEIIARLRRRPPAHRRAHARPTDRANC